MDDDDDDDVVSKFCTQNKNIQREKKIGHTIDCRVVHLMADQRPINIPINQMQEMKKIKTKKNSE